MALAKKRERALAGGREGGRAVTKTGKRKR